MMLAGLISSATVGTAAQSEGIDGTTFTGVNFDWSVEWDADAWDVIDEDNTGGTDYFVLESAEVDFGMVGFAVRGDFATIGDCTKNWVDSVGYGDGATDFDRIADPTGLPVQSDAATAAFSYRQELQSSVEEMVGYVQCLPVDDSGGFIAANVMTTDADLDAYVPSLGAILAAIETPDAEITSLADDGRDEAEATVEPDSVTETSGETDATTDTAEDGDSGVNGTTFTGVFHDWSVTWDEADWVFDAEDNRDGNDTLWLNHADGEWAIVTFLTTADANDAEACASGWLRTMAGVQGVENFERDDSLVTPPIPDGATGYAYTYTQDDTDAAAYVECRVLPAKDTALAMVLTADPDAFDEKIDLFADLLETLRVGNASGSSNGADAASTGSSDSGIDPESQSYVSPTYGYELDWSGTDLEAIVDDEEVNALPDDVALDRLLLFMPGAKLYVEGRVDYDGDAAECIETESEILEFHDGVTNIEPVENDAGFPEAGESDAGGEYATYHLTQEQDGETIIRIAYVECRTLVEDEAVMVISLYAREETFEDAWDAASAVMDSIEL